MEIQGVNKISIFSREIKFIDYQVRGLNRIILGIDVVNTDVPIPGPPL